MLRIIIVGISFKGRYHRQKVDDSKLVGTYHIHNHNINGQQSKLFLRCLCLKT